MFLSSLFAVLLISGSVSSLEIQRSGRIIGGEDTTIEEHPYMVSIQLASSIFSRIFSRYHHYCGGSIISERWVLTAYHCLGSPIHHYRILAGSAKFDKGEAYKPDLKLTYENKSIEVLGDIGLIRVTKAFAFGPTIQPVKLIEDGKQLSGGTEGQITGWGQTLRGTPSNLQVVTVPIVERDVCDQAYRLYGGVTKDTICAGYYKIGGARDACRADSGGPLVIRGEQVGIVSWGIGCAESDYPGVYTEVAYYRNWIDENIKQ